MTKAVDEGFTAAVPGAGETRAMAGAGFLSRAPFSRTSIISPPTTSTSSAHPSGPGGFPQRHRRRFPATPLRRVRPLLPPRGWFLRQGHPRHFPRPLGSTRSRCSSTACPRTPRITSATPRFREKEFLRRWRFLPVSTSHRGLGLNAARKYDCYAWLQPAQQRYREVTSINCTQFQARRLGIGTAPRRAPSTSASTAHCHDGSSHHAAENHQQADGRCASRALRPHPQRPRVLPRRADPHPTDGPTRPANDSGGALWPGRRPQLGRLMTFKPALVASSTAPSSASATFPTRCAMRGTACRHGGVPVVLDRSGHGAGHR